MYYKVVRPLLSRVPAYSEKEEWRQFLKQFDLPHVIDYCSINGALVEDLLGIPTAEMWDHLDYIMSNKLFLINNLKFAKELAARHPGSRIFGVQFAPKPEELAASSDLLGFDILDEYAHYSLLEDTRWLKNHYGKQVLNQYALLDSIEQALEIKNILRTQFGEGDWHARACEVWAIFKVTH